MTDRLAGMLSLSMKAGKLRTGEFSVERSVKSGKAKLCLIAADASENTRKKFEAICRSGKVPCVPSGFGKKELGALAGQGERTTAAIEDTGFAENILRLMEGRQTQ